MKKLNSILDIHADDYALSPNSDSDIINLCKLGKLNSISIIPNLKIFNLSVQNFLKEKNSFPNEIKVSVHTNVMEGKCCYSNPAELPHLVNTEGYFITSWGKLFVQNYIPFLRNKIIIELKKEIIAQIETCINANVINTNGIRIDSHQHPHMIPLFYEAIFEALDEKKYSVEYKDKGCGALRWVLEKEGHHTTVLYIDSPCFYKDITTCRKFAEIRIHPDLSAQTCILKEPAYQLNFEKGYHFVKNQIQELWNDFMTC